jgi:protein O-GlcNAc transferase
LTDQYRQALALHRAGRLDEAERVYRAILKEDANRVDALSNLGTLCLQQGDWEECDRLLGLSLAINPDQPLAQLNRGIALRALKRFDEALGCYDRAIALDPARAEAFHNRGNLLGEMGRPDEAIASYDRAVAIKPAYATAFNSRGNALCQLKRHQEAIASYDCAIAVKPDYAEAFNNRGTALCDLGRNGEAISSFDRAIALRPDFAEAYNNRGIALNDLKRHAEAIASCERAIALRPDNWRAFINHGNALQELGRPDEALGSYERAIALNPASAEAFVSCGNVLKTLGRLDKALASYARASAVNPDHAYLPGNLLHTQMQMCDWAGLESRGEQTLAGVALGRESCPPFAMLAMPSTPAQQLQCARIYARNRCPVRSRDSVGKPGYEHERIRVGYFSADFHDHATTHLIAELFELHDRARFEVIGISYGAPRQDAMRQRVSSAFDRFVDASRLSDQQIAEWTREHEIDIAVDLKGYTTESRPGILSWRPAPVQVSYLGYPGTMGTEFIDYIVADPILIPDEHRQFYAEKIAYLPDSYQVNDRKRPIADGARTRRELVLPESGFVFCCFNNGFKITPDLFAVWMRLLHRVPDSVLWLLEDNSFARDLLRRAAEQHGISPARLIFAPRVALPEHLARHRAADLFLDTFYYNAHTTASDALWAGLPVLTCLGKTFAGRVGASLLTAVGLPELITHSHEEYEATACALATHRQRLAVITRQLADRRLTHPLFDTPRFAGNLESVYVQMWSRQQQGLAPDHLYA